MGCGTLVRSPMRSSINCANSISSPGTCLVDALAHVVHHLLDAPARRRLERDEEVALVGLGQAAAELQAGAPGIGGDFRRVAQDVLELAQEPVGLGQRGARRAVVVDVEAALVHPGHEARADVLVGDVADDEKRQQPEQHQPRPREATSPSAARSRRAGGRSSGPRRPARRPFRRAAGRPAPARPAASPDRK